MKDLIALVPVTDIKGEKNREQLENLLDSPCFPELRVCLIFDACDEDFIEHFETKYPFVEKIVNTGNRLNFARNVNTGMRMARDKGLSVIVINQDCKLPNYESMMKMTVRDDAIISATAVNEEKLPESTNEITKINNKVAFYCVYIPHKIMEKIGILEGAFIVTFEDDEYATRALLAGFDILVAGVYINHEGSFIDTSVAWESASGAYNQNDLNSALNSYYLKYQIPETVKHHEGQVIPWILEHHEWNEEMRIL